MSVDRSFMNSVGSSQKTSIRIPADERFLPVVMAFVEQSCRVLGLGRPEALRMTLASEELFLHLCRSGVRQTDEIRIRCACKGHFVQSDFIFSGPDFNMQAFNLTATPRQPDNEDFGEMGLILASRSVDRLKIRRDADALRISLIKEKKYPESREPAAAISLFSGNDWEVRCPTADELKYFAALTRTEYAGPALPPFFQYPGRLVDMIQGGRYHALIAAGPAGELAGGILWHGAGRRTVEAIGPYVFAGSGKRDIAASLIETAISEAGRTDAVAMICHPPEDGPWAAYFELLGEMDRCTAGESRVRQTVWFRLLHEDTGCVTWMPPELEDYLLPVYRRLFLPREIRPIADDGENRPAGSVMSTRIDRPASRADLEILWPGADLEENLLRHLALFQNEGICQVIFEIDMGESWQSAAIPGLLKNGFKPVLLQPYAGQGDTVLFQWLPSGAP